MPGHHRAKPKPPIATARKGGSVGPAIGLAVLTVAIAAGLGLLNRLPRPEPQPPPPPPNVSVTRDPAERWLIVQQLLAAGREEEALALLEHAVAMLPEEAAAHEQLHSMLQAAALADASAARRLDAQLRRDPELLTRDDCLRVPAHLLAEQTFDEPFIITAASQGSDGAPLSEVPTLSEVLGLQRLRRRYGEAIVKHGDPSSLVANGLGKQPTMPLGEALCVQCESSSTRNRGQLNRITFTNLDEVLPANESRQVLASLAAVAAVRRLNRYTLTAAGKQLSGEAPRTASSTPHSSARWVSPQPRHKGTTVRCTVDDDEVAPVDLLTYAPQAPGSASAGTSTPKLSSCSPRGARSGTNPYP